MSTLPTDSQERKDIPIARGFLDYFPAAVAEVARLSKAGNDKHNPGEELHWARGKSMDHADCIMRHLAERGTIDTDGFSHTVKVAWRAMALLQEELEAAGAPMSRGSRVIAAELKALLGSARPEVPALAKGEVRITLNGRSFNWRPVTGCSCEACRAARETSA